MNFATETNREIGPMRILIGSFLLLAPFLTAIGAPGRQTVPKPGDEWRSALSSVVAAERAFNRAAVEKGTKEAFLAFMTAEAVLFRPQPVPGVKWMQERPAPTGSLSWRPVFADVSAAGDLGYTTGPYELRKDPADPVAASFGNYVTIWKRQPDSSWKVLIDLGTVNPPPAKTLPDFDPSQAKPAVNAKPGMGADAASSMLASLDRRLSSMSAVQGPAAALRLHVEKEARFMRSGRQPAVSAREVEALLPAEPGIWTWDPAKSYGSISGDMGYTYGAFQLQHMKSGEGPAQSGYYLRIWKKQSNDEWKIVLDIVLF
jgi:ketosteroid isomerase-like protein